MGGRGGGVAGEGVGGGQCCREISRKAIYRD